MVEGRFKGIQEASRAMGAKVGLEVIVGGRVGIAGVEAAAVGEMVSEAAVERVTVMGMLWVKVGVWDKATLTVGDKEYVVDDELGATCAGALARKRQKTSPSEADRNAPARHKPASRNRVMVKAVW